MQENDLAVLTEGAQDYVDYVTQLEERYLKAYGEVLTFGSGDCGQLAHGVTEDEDLMVRFPRIVYSLRYSSIGLYLKVSLLHRDKRVVSIACGGLHNAVITEEVATIVSLVTSSFIFIRVWCTHGDATTTARWADLAKRACLTSWRLWLRYASSRSRVEMARRSQFPLLERSSAGAATRTKKVLEGPGKPHK